MSKRVIVDVPGFPTVNPTYNHAVRFGEFIFVSGQIGTDPVTGKLVPGGQAAEYRRALMNLQLVLEAAGSSLQRVIKTTIYMTNVDELADLNEIYAEFFPERAPAKTGVEVKRLAIGAQIEIEAIASAL